jgi:hypothetical protein
MTSHRTTTAARPCEPSELAGVLAASLLLLVAACGSKQPTADDNARAADAALYAAAGAGDCDAVLGHATPDLRAQLEDVGCEEMIARFQERPVARVVGAVVDGRDTSARLVRVELRDAREVLVRVRQRSGRWMVESL